MGWILRSSTHPLLAGSQRWEIGNARPFSSVAADRFLRFPLLVEQDSSPSDEPESSGESEGMLFPFVAHQAVRKRSEVEAVLFLAREPLSSGKIAQLASISGGNEVRKLVRTLNRHYDRRRRAVRIVEVAGGFQLRTRPQFAPWLRRWMPESVEIRLTQPAFETLAVVAYLQPVLRATVEKIRGVRCTDFLRQLMEMDLVKITGRQEELGRPFLYGTTRGFLQTFGLKNLDDLPRREQMRRFAS